MGGKMGDGREGEGDEEGCHVCSPVVQIGNWELGGDAMPSATWQF